MQNFYCFQHDQKTHSMCIRLHPLTQNKLAIQNQKAISAEILEKKNLVGIWKKEVV